MRRGSTVCVRDLAIGRGRGLHFVRWWQACLVALSDAGVDQAGGQASSGVGVAHLLVVARAGEDVGMRRATQVAATRYVGAVTVNGVDAARGAENHDE